MTRSLDPLLVLLPLALIGCEAPVDVGSGSVALQRCADGECPEPGQEARQQEMPTKAAAETQSPGIPPIDAQAPERIETATFGLG